MNFLRRDKSSKSNLKQSRHLSTAGQLLDLTTPNSSRANSSVGSAQTSPTNIAHPTIPFKKSSIGISPTHSSSSLRDLVNMNHLFTYKYDDEKDDYPVLSKKNTANSQGSLDRYSPRSSIVSLPLEDSEKDSRKGSTTSSGRPSISPGTTRQPSTISPGTTRQGSASSETTQGSTSSQTAGSNQTRHGTISPGHTGSVSGPSRQGSTSSPGSVPSQASTRQPSTYKERKDSKTPTLAASKSYIGSLKDNYRGFHANKVPEGHPNVPPLSQPIKPRFKKKNGSLLNKFIHRKDTDDQERHSSISQDLNSVHTTGTNSARSSRNNSIANSNRSSSVGSTLDGQSYTPQLETSIESQIVEEPIRKHSSAARIFSSLTLDHPLKTVSTTPVEAPIVEATIEEVPKKNIFSMDMNLDEMQDIVKVTSPNGEVKIYAPVAAELKNSISGPVPSDSWKAPDSWDVKIENAGKDTASLFESDESEGEAVNDLSAIEKKNISRNSSKKTTSTKVRPSKPIVVQVPIRSPGPGILLPQATLPVLYGSRQAAHVVPDSKNTVKGPNHIVRVFKEDNTFTTILCPLETTTAELLATVKRKFFLESTSNYQLSVHVATCVKVLEPYEKPIKIQTGLLMLSGYTEQDNFKMIGREDLSYIVKFVVENIYLRNLTHDEEVLLSKDYVDVNIAGLKLKNIPIIFHQHTYEIEKLNVADNPSIYIPLDFIQSCNNLTNINFAKNGCSKFPMNFLEAKKLTHLNMEKNFLDELPSKFSHLRNLTHLKLNSNQLTHLPKSFGKLQNLISLNLSSNYFNSYPEPISDLENLRDLDLSYNDLSEVPESIGKLTNLFKLNLCTNKLSRTLPQYFTKLISLKRLDVRFNQLSNVDVLGSLPNLEVAYASKNNITTFSDKVESLRLLHFDRNPITNLHFENLLPLLTILDLSKAKITSIPSEFLSRIPHVEKFVLDKNHLVELPKELGDLHKLAHLSLYGNNLQTIPSTIGLLTNLQFLDLHSNNLQSLPDDIWNLKSLTVLNVASNILSSFPKPPTSVTKRISSSVNFKNFIADPIYNSTRLGPDSRRPSTSESEGSSAYDQLDGSLSFTNHSSSMADNLLVLILSDNRLGDDVFESISFLTALKSLNLSYNDILEIPEGALRRLTHLVEVYLSGNELATLPADDFENLKQLRLLFLNNNKLVSLPAELSKLVNLQDLDLGSNQLKYNISNWPYDWSWHWNKNLRYLNFSGNKRFEIKQTHVKNPETGQDFDSLLVLKNLKVLGLIDVTLTTPSVPEQSSEMRIRTTASESNNLGYGVSDSMGMREHVSSRDLFLQKFRGQEGEVLICSFDGKGELLTQGHKISALAKTLFVPAFTAELEKIKSDSEIKDAIRKTFLSLNKEINGVFAAKKNHSYTAPPMKKDHIELSLRDDSSAGCSITVIYIKDKKLYSANIGDIGALLSRNNGDHVLLTTKHDPTTRSEFERIRASGGYVSGDGALDGDLSISRGVGFFDYLPHTHSGPSITEISLTTADDMIVVATKVLWDYITYELAVDILRQEKDDAMLAAQKLRDYAICYGASDKIAVIVLTLGGQKANKLKFGSNGLYNNLGRESELFGNKKKRDRAAVTGDSQLRRLEEEIEPPVGELALVFTDIKNSTLLWDAFPLPMRSAIKTHNAIMRRQLRIVGGYEVKTEGDAFMVSFPSPTSALLWCFNVQQILLTADWPSEILESDQCCEVTDNTGNVIFRGLSVRMGIHWGSPVCEPDVVTSRMDYFGPMVNRASRVSAIADGGQITVSSDFLTEIKKLYKIHADVVTGKLDLIEAYEGNQHAGEIINKEIKGIEDIGCHYIPMGEKKLKGLEQLELITLAYPTKLKIRFEMLQKRLSQAQNDNATSRIVGALPVDAIYGLRALSLKLENLCASLNGGASMTEGYQTYFSSILQQKTTDLFQDVDILYLLNHIVTRIESCTATLALRQEMSLATGGQGKIEFVDGKSIACVLQELSELVSHYHILVKDEEERPKYGGAAEWY